MPYVRELVAQRAHHPARELLLDRGDRCTRPARRGGSPRSSARRAEVRRRPRRSRLSSIATSWPSRRMLSTVTSVEGIEAPLAIELEIAVWTMRHALLDADDVVERSPSRSVVEVHLEPAPSRGALAHQPDPAARPLGPEHAGLVAEDDRRRRVAAGDHARDHVGVVLVGVHRGSEKLTCGDGRHARRRGRSSRRWIILSTSCRQSKIQRLSMPCLASVRIQSSTIESGVTPMPDDAVGARAGAQGRVRQRGADRVEALPRVLVVVADHAPRRSSCR